jgi:hypothetical protein
VDTRDLPFFGISGLVNLTGDRVFVRTQATVEAFAFDAATGALGAAPLFSIPERGNPNSAHIGADTMALSPDGTRLYVSANAGLRIYDPNTGDLLTTITGAGLNFTDSGVAVAGGQPQ